MLAGAAPFNSRTAVSAEVRASSSMDISDPPTIPAPKYTQRSKHGRIGSGVKVSEHTFVRICGSRRIGAER
jgi:hypothetical protein